MEQVTKRVADTVRGWDRGRIFFLDDFLELGHPVRVRCALADLAKDGTILRLARGIYCYPRLEGGNSMKTVPPGPELIAHALAARERVRIIPFGDQAAYQLGLMGITLSDLKYITDGADRTINLTNGKKIHFFHTDEVKMFDFCNGTMQMASLAIRFLQKEQMTVERKRILQERLKTVPEREFIKDLALPPAWVVEILLELR